MAPSRIKSRPIYLDIVKWRAKMLSMNTVSSIQDTPSTEPLQDGFQRSITYLRLSVTDRCDFRCLYCMAEEMIFQPRDQILRLEELVAVARTFVALGVQKIRLTGGEPLIRRGFVDLVRQLADLPGLKELAMTTNGARLAALAGPLRDAGLDRLNVSLDSLQPDRFRAITRVGSLEAVLAGIEAARQAGFQRIKLNVVPMRNRNFDEIPDLVRFAVERALDISFIEEMPLGLVDDRSRAEEFCSSEEVRAELSSAFDLIPSTHSSGGPARYWQVAGTSTRVGFISPHSHNFCGSCNRVRVTADGLLLPCLGHEQATDLRPALREAADTEGALRQLIRAGIDKKPEKHHFVLTESPVIFRHMNRTGG